MNNDLDELGKEIVNEISNAILKGHYQNLNKKISGIAGDAVKTAGREMKKAFYGSSEQNTFDEEYDYSSPAGTMKDVKGRNVKRSDVTLNDDWEETVTAKRINRINEEHRKRKASLTNDRNGSSILYDKAIAQKLKSIISMILGYPAGLILLLMITINAATISPWWLIGLIFPVTILGFAAFGTAGIMKYTRFDKYVSALAGRTYGDIKKLADAVGRTEKATVKDLKKMISAGLFRQGHLDEGETTLITSDEAYEQYLIAEKDHQARLEEERREQERINRQQAVWTEEQRQMFAACDEYIEEIRSCNKRIPGQVMTEKIDRMEKSVRLILERAKKQPSLVDDLRRLMNYYLPTTVKLLNAYADLDSQEKTSDNIEKSKKEIEDTIDTLNDAFDKLFDELFEDTSLDISTDAQVMKTLLEQEGLTAHSFTSDLKM